MTHQQKSLFHFLWNDSASTAVPKEYQMAVHVFGAVSSPTTCIYALRKTTEDFGSRFPTVAAVVLNNIYVDNYLDSTRFRCLCLSPIRISIRKFPAQPASRKGKSCAITPAFYFKVRTTRISSLCSSQRLSYEGTRTNRISDFLLVLFPNRTKMDPF